MKEAKRFSRIALRVWKKKKKEKRKRKTEKRKQDGKKRRRRKKEKERWKERRGRDIRTKLLNKITQQNYSYANKITQNYSTNETVLCNSTEQN